MLADPQSVYLEGAAQSLAAISRGENQSVYRSADGKYKLTVGHQFRPERNRFVQRLDISMIAADPLSTDRNIPVTAAVYLVMDVPVVGMTTAQVNDFVNGAVDYFTLARCQVVLSGQT